MRDGEKKMEDLSQEKKKEIRPFDEESASRSATRRGRKRERERRTFAGEKRQSPPVASTVENARYFFARKGKSPPRPGGRKHHGEASITKKPVKRGKNSPQKRDGFAREAERKLGSDARGEKKN